MLVRVLHSSYRIASGRGAVATSRLAMLLNGLVPANVMNRKAQMRTQ